MTTTWDVPRGQQVVTWNLDWWQRHGPQPRRIPTILGRPAAAWLLQELKPGVFRELSARWTGPAVSTTEVWEPATSRWLATGVLLPDGATVHDVGCVTTLPRPQRSLWVDADLPDLGRVTLVSWHTENAATDLRRKMHCYRAMHDWLADRAGDVVLGVDTNSWHDPVDLGPADPAHSHHDEHDFLGAGARHGLVDAHRQVLARDGQLDELRRLRPEGPLAVSYELSDGAGHRMDRLLATPSLVATASTYDLEAAVDAGSDHAIHAAFYERPQ